MFPTRFHSPFVALCLLVGTTSHAQPQPPQKADPLDAKASVPRVEYTGSLARYKRYSEEPVGSWRKANETVNAIGGWRSYAREAAAAAAAAAAATAASAPASTPAPAAAPPNSAVKPSAGGHKH
jgi:hypothetical protein